jgi:hypothetical protein
MFATRGIIFVVVFCLLLLAILVGAVLLALKQKKTVKTMLLGLSLIAFGGLLSLETGINFDRFLYCLQFIGLVIVIVGFTRNDHE